MEHSSKPHLFYWNVRGLGSLLIMAFEATGVDFDLTEYTAQDEDAWFARDKPALADMTLPNLPYLKDGKVLISEHDAIFRHIMRKYNPALLGGADNDAQAEVDQFITFWMKTNMEIREFCYTAKDTSPEDRQAQLDRY